MTSHHSLDALRYAAESFKREYLCEVWPDVEQFVEGLAQEEAYDPEFMKELESFKREYLCEVWPDVEQFVEGLAQEEAYDPEFMKELKAIETREKI